LDLKLIPIESYKKLKMKKYLLLADLFNYPSIELADSLTAWENEKGTKTPGEKLVLKKFKEHIESKNIGEQQEYYSKTFDVNALCCIDIGYVIFGEDYKRGEFLVNMQNEQKNAGHQFETELADYLPNVLRLFYYHKNREFVDEIIDNFRSPDNIYRNLLVMLLEILKKDFGHCTMEQMNILKEKDNKIFNRACKV